MSSGYDLFIKSMVDYVGRDVGIDESLYELLLKGLSPEEQELCTSTSDDNIERTFVHMKILMRYLDVEEGFTDLSHEDVMYITQKSSITELPINHSTFIEALENNIHTIGDAHNAILNGVVSGDFIADVTLALSEICESDSVRLIVE